MAGWPSTPAAAVPPGLIKPGVDGAREPGIDCTAAAYGLRIINYVCAFDHGGNDEKYSTSVRPGGAVDCASGGLGCGDAEANPGMLAYAKNALKLIMTQNSNIERVLLGQDLAGPDDRRGPPPGAARK